jgi:hypothetical protein
MKHDCSIQSVQRLYVAFKQGKRRKIKRLRINEYKSYPCEYCGSHTYLDAVVGPLKSPVTTMNEEVF